MKIKFEISNLLCLHNLAFVGERLHGQQNDPQILFSWPRKFRAGWYEFELQLDEEIGGTPQIFFNMGNGFNEIERINLVRKGSQAVYRGLIKLPSRPLQVRLDPSDNNNAFVIENFGASRKPLPSVITRGVLRVARTALNDPSRVRPMIERGRELLTGKTLAGVNIRTEEPARAKDPYTSWRETYDFDLERDRESYLRDLAGVANPPLISILMPTYNTNPAHLKETIESVRAQLYENWELCIADDASTDPRVEKVLTAASQRDPRIKVRFRRVNGHIAEASNSAIALATGEWVVMLDHDDLLRPHSLAEIVLMAARRPDAQIIYSDEDKVDDSGRRFDPHFKSDYSPDLFRSMNYFNHVTAHRRDNIFAVGGWRKGYEGAQDYDLNLRIIDLVGGQGIYHIPRILYHWRATAGSTALAQGEKTYAWRAGKRALDDHIARSGIDAEIVEIEDVPFYRTRYKIAEPAPLVTLIIPTRDKVDVLKLAVSSILEKTDYPNYEILIIDNGSVETETLAYFQELLQSGARVSILEWNFPFNYSALNNFGVTKARGEIIGLINNDVEVLSPGWLTEMVSWVQQERIGCVGAKLYYPDRTIQHAGIVAGIGGVAGHSHKYFDGQSNGYFSRLKVAQNVSAVTAACLLVRKSVFEQVGGLDEEGLTVAFNDVDFCFRVASMGLLNVWTPWAELIHYESKSRGAEDTPEKVRRFQQEIRQMQARWPDMIARDPFYNPNLTLEHEDFSLRL